MKKLNTFSMVMAFSLSAAVIANPAAAKSENSKEDQNILVGMGSGAVMGAAIAGPVGGVVGGIIGTFIGNDANHDIARKQMAVTVNDYQTQLQQAEHLAQQNKREYEDALAQLREIERQRSLVNMPLTPDSSVAPIELNLQFDTASHQIPSHYYSGLDDVAKQLKQDPKLRVQLFGYADRRGDDKYNQTLSEARAKSVKAYLVQQGVAAAKIDTDGYGEAQPVAKQQSFQNDFYDRRVVIRLAKQEQLHTASN